MKVVLHTQRLMEAVLLATQVIGKKESLPVLSCFLIEAFKNNIVIRATNLESGVEINIPARVSEPGVFAVPANIFLQTLKTIHTTETPIEYSNKNISIQTTSNTNNIHTLPHEEFPTLPIPKKGSRFSIPTKTLCGGIRSVVYAAASSTIRPEFSSVFITHKEEFLICVATDSFRLAEKKIPLSVKKTIPDILIPAKNSIDMLHLFEKNTEEAGCIVADNQLHVLAGNTSFISRVVDATFPHYEDIIPKNKNTEAILLKEDFINTLQKARTFSGEAQHIGFHIYPQKKIFSTTAQHANIGSMSDFVEAAITGEDIDINFNIPLIQDCLQSITTDSVVLRFAGPNKPLVIKGVSDETFLYLVMPLNK